jgi:hypothetical protein
MMRRLLAGLLVALALVPAALAQTTGKPGLDSMGQTSSARLRAVVPDATGTGALVFGTAPTISLEHGSGLPIAGLSGLGTGISTALGVNAGSSGALAVLSGTLTPGNIAIASDDGKGFKDSNYQLITTFGAGQVPCNPTSNSAGPVSLCSQLAMPAGTAGAPTYSFYADPTSGLFLNSSNILGLAVGGVQLLKYHKPSGTASWDLSAGSTPLLAAVDSGSGNATALIAGAGTSGVDLEYNSGVADSGVTPRLARFFGNGLGATNNVITFTAAASGSAVRIGAAGSSDTNISINVQPAGSGTFQYNGNAVLYSGGALGTPSSATLANATGLPVSTGITGLGTNVATALAVNVGSAGAFVTNGGALGTPSSGSAANLTGLPLSSVTGLGTNVATALAVNVGTAGAFVTNGGALGTPSSGVGTNLTSLTAGNLTGQVAKANGGTGSTTGQGASSNLSTPYVQCHTSTDASVTGGVAETILGWCNVAGSVLGTNGCVMADLSWQFNAGGSPANWTQIVRIVTGTSNGTTGGTGLLSATVTQPQNGRNNFKICNSNSASSQWMWGNTASFGFSTAGYATSAINTGSAFTVSFNATPGNSGDTIHLKGLTGTLVQTAGN